MSRRLACVVSALDATAVHAARPEVPARGTWVDQAAPQRRGIYTNWKPLVCLRRVAQDVGDFLSLGDIGVRED